MARALVAAAANLLLLFSLLVFSVEAANDTTFETISRGSPFSDSSRTYFNVLGNADINNDALQLTIDSSNVDSYFVNNSGRVIYKRPFKIWDDSPLSSNSSGSQKRVISFNSTFIFNIFPVKNMTVGEGLVFGIFPDGETIPENSYGQYLGLTNSSTDGNPANRFVAVEFDTFKQPYDPDNNHVGLDINSVRSNVFRSLSDVNISLAPWQGIKYKAWVEYSGPLRRIELYLAEETKPKPAAPLLNATLDLSAILSQRSYFGFAGSTGERFQLNCILGWNLTVEILPEKSSPSSLSWFLKVGVPILGVLLLAVAALGFWLYRRVERDEKLLGALKSLPGTPREFQYKVLKKATGNFDITNQLGNGGYGVVYKGVIPGESAAVAVKMFSRENMQGDFIAELTIINRLRHRNLVRLIGWCHKNGRLLLVYEFMPNGSLDQHLFNTLPGKHLSWQQRQRVIAGVASALHYLHYEYDQRVVHRDIKASNVLLDADFNARLGDFGLARTIEDERTSYVEIEMDGVPGTMGYIAPECFHTGKATRESDVFGFGVVVLEVVCGRRPRFDSGPFRLLAEWVWNLYREGKILTAVDPQLGDKYDQEEAARLLLLGLACTNPNSSDRPKTDAVLQIIYGSAPGPEIPLLRPAFMWPPASGELQEKSPDTTQTSSTAGSSSNAFGTLYSGNSDFRDISSR